MRSAFVVLVLASGLIACGGQQARSRQGTPARAHDDSLEEISFDETDDGSGDAVARRVAQDLGLSPDDVQWSPRRLRFAVALHDGRDEVSQILIFDRSGHQSLSFEVEGKSVPLELQFLHENLIGYRSPKDPRPVVEENRARMRRAKNKTSVAASAAEPPDVMTAPRARYVLQPLGPSSTPIVCEGRQFAWSPARDHLAWVGGEPKSEFIGVDGAQVYPRRGRSNITSAPSWSPDGRSLAFIETRGNDSRLVVLVETDNPSGDNTWPLPGWPDQPELHVSWTGPGRVVVGESLTKPRFAVSFARER